ncbi:MAG: hypothetical protein DME35_08910 [Verrucomicrobia bacterium]|nr:MAG: hypothetical protein DME35_08910 [Verrucomicrobiota bacterium]
MKAHARSAAGFSLVEITLALGVAAFCLIAVFGLVPVALNTQQASVNQTKANAIISQVIWAAQATPDTLYFTNDGNQTPPHTINVSPPADAVFRVKVSYLFPPTATTSIAKITISWPAAQSDLTKVVGSIDMFAAVNR